MKDFQSALDILEAESHIAFVEFVKVRLGYPPTVMMQADKKFITAGILCKVDKAGVTVFQDIVHEFLDNPKNDELIFRLQPFTIVMEAGACVHAARSTDLLKKVVDSRFQTEIL